MCFFDHGQCFSYYNLSFDKASSSVELPAIKLSYGDTYHTLYKRNKGHISKKKLLAVSLNVSIGRRNMSNPNKADYAPLTPSLKVLNLTRPGLDSWVGCPSKAEIKKLVEKQAIMAEKNCGGKIVWHLSRHYFS